MNLQPEALFHNRYKLQMRIGAGGYSQVWLAHDTRADNMEVALKIFAPGQGLDTQGLSVFSKEYSTVFNLNHGNLLKPMHFDEYDGSPYLVLPYCPHGSVFSMVGETDEKVLALFLKQASSALEYLHRQDPPIIHQDIKPDNFLIDKEGQFLLADFGISSKIRRTLTRSMGEQTSAGTMAYMPPEKFTAERLAVKAGDIFSLGATMYELLVGEWPFGQHGGLTLNAGAEIPSLPNRFSSGLNDIVRACMAKEPWDRPTAAELENLASEFLKTGEWPSILKKEVEVAPVEAAESPGLKTVIDGSTSPGKSSKTKNKLVRNILFGVVAVISILVTVVYLSENEILSNDVTPEIDTVSEVITTPVVADTIEPEPQPTVQIAEVNPEEEEWNQARSANTRTAYENYIKKYPSGTYTREARNAMASLEVRLTGLKDTWGDVFDYVGEVRNGVPHGRGRSTYASGDVYEGSYRNGKMHGNGSYTFINGNKYTGNLTDDKLNGQGTFIWKSGDKYVGEFKDQQFTGRGTYTYASGERYVGDFVNLQFHGRGKMTYAEGDTYEGEYSEHKRHGEGTYIAFGTERYLTNCPDCSKYVGTWVSDKKQGFGRCYNSSGRLIFEGQFKNDRPSGTYPNR